MGKIVLLTPLYGDDSSTKERLFKLYGKKILKKSSFTKQDTRREMPNFEDMVKRNPAFYFRLDGKDLCDFMDSIERSVDKALIVGLLSLLRQSFIRTYYELYNFKYAQLFTNQNFKDFKEDNTCVYGDRKVSLYLETDILYIDTNRVGELIRTLSETFKEMPKLTIYVSLI